MSGLRIGLQVNTTQRAFRWREVRDLALAAERAGFDSLWVEDHLFYAPKGRVVGPWEGWTTLAALAEVTERVRIGSFVTPLGIRHPALLAKQAATVDEIADGRLVLGVGAGWNEAEHRAVGVGLEARAARFDEALRVLLAAFDEDEVRFSGRHFASDGFRLIPKGPRPRPELLVGSTGPRVLRSALPHVDGWNWDGFENDPEDFAAESRKVDEVCAEVGRDPATVARSAHLIVRLADAEGLPIDPLPDGFREIGGGVDEVAASFKAFADAGADELQLIVDPARPTALELVAAAGRLANA